MAKTPWFRTSLLGALVGLSACPSDPPANMDVKVLKGPSKSSTIALADDDSVVAVVNPEDNSVSFFTTSNNQRLAKVATGKEPSSVVIHPDNTTAFVANRADATVVKISGINTGSPTVSSPVNVGSEPAGLALSPTGAKLFVAEYAESSVGVIDTATMVRSDFVPVVRSPRALAVTNNGDMSDADETVVVPEFFGEVLPDKEARNDGRIGKVHLYGTDGADKGVITLQPFTNPGAPGNMFETQTSPNQLYSVAIDRDGKIYIPTISASPNLPLRSDQNVYPVVYVADLASKQEVRQGAGTANLAELVNALPAATGGAPATRWFLGETVDLAFKPTSKIAYAVSRAAEVVQRVDYSGGATAIGSPQRQQIDVLGMPMSATSCQQPNGIVVANSLEKAYVNCWVTRRLAVLDLTSQAVETVVESSPLPTAAPELQIVRGRHFFFTGRGRWSGNAVGANPGQDPTENGSAWSSCGTCHPDGLTDNITWIFAAGPRQSTSMDGSFSHGSGPQKQRIFNWTAVIDEMHDFDANTRGTSGGKGAITTGTSCGNLAMETRSGLPGGLGVAAAVMTPRASAKDLQDSQANNCVRDWDDINEYSKSIRPPRARRFVDAASVARGAAIFGNKGGCVKCHGGAGWTVSRRFYTPSQANNTLPSAAMMMPNSLGDEPYSAVGLPFQSFAAANANQISAQATASEVAPFNLAALGPPQVTCVLRNVGTFGVPMNTPATDALEARGGAMMRAQGRGGYNVPSLYGLALGAPFLHHGQAKTLDELFSDSKWQTHWQAGNPNFLTDAAAAMDRADLINFLWSVDAAQPEQAVPAMFDEGCRCRDGSVPPATGCAP